MHPADLREHFRAQQQAGRASSSVLRHTFATHALRARPNLRAVQELLGHSSVTITQRYTNTDAEELRRQVAELPASRFLG